MTSFQQMSSDLQEIKEAERLSIGMLAYFRARLRNRIYDLVMREFLVRETSARLTKADVARRMRSTPDRVSKLFRSPGNWTLKTVSDLLIAMGAEPEIGISLVGGQPPRNISLPDWAYIEEPQFHGGDHRSHRVLTLDSTASTTSEVSR